MVGLSAAGESAVLGPLVTTAFVSLHTADPGVGGSSEVTGGGYARQGPINFTEAGANPTVASNTALLAFPQATAAWGTISHFGLWTAASGGTYQGSGALTASGPVNNGDTARFLVGSLTITAQ